MQNPCIGIRPGSMIITDVRFNKQQTQTCKHKAAIASCTIMLFCQTNRGKLMVYLFALGLAECNCGRPLMVLKVHGI